MTKQLISSGSHLEPEIGFSRAVRKGNWIFVAGTAPITSDGTDQVSPDVYAQTRRCLEIIGEALREAGAPLAAVVRTRIMLTDIETWRDAAKAHGEVFGEVRPASTFVEVSRFIDARWKVEVEADAIIA
ncbi:RidA family protein [Salipiger mucosus]|uniref:RidA family protein n=1 Tax=Salipiger mucosus TaxID=263378 RepID=UPI0005622A1A|nr:RidA family protein [Salipiger mucosus]